MTYSEEWEEQDTCTRFSCFGEASRQFPSISLAQNFDTFYRGKTGKNSRFLSRNYTLFEQKTGLFSLQHTIFAHAEIVKNQQFSSISRSITAFLVCFTPF